MQSTQDVEAWKFPAIKTIVSVATTPKTFKATQTQEERIYYGVYFYPYTRPGDDPVFAVVGGTEVLIIRPNDMNGFEIIMAFQDDGFGGGGGLSAGCWTVDKHTGAPLLAVGGSGSVVKILDIWQGECVQTLTGHGEELMDLVTSPIDQSIIVTTGADTTIRFWSLDPAHQKQPCSIICAGEDHRETVLTIAFHHTGRYLLSGGMDHSVNLWVIPEDAGEMAGTDKPKRIMYPHFSTAMIHTNYVDCVAFHGDYILSRAADENIIVLWAIQNFSSKDPPPGPELAPTTHEYRDTRSAFGGSFERLLQFQANDTIPFYMHFNLFASPGHHPLLAMGATTGRVYLWDLYMIEQYGRGAGIGDDVASSVPPARESSCSVTPGAGTPAPGKVHVKRDDISELFGKVRPHATLEFKQAKGGVRHIAFSNDGRYMVAVGHMSQINICKRW
ncbi:WD40-repeat-containing domain protein [Tricharina praecox]|uniref:WD40-repeat-containing domain protein n=1 Tax=Tricharina praecox TaxID=43433 RepID=UPI00221F76CC|nr:WD40-repeat-containing domain protein [Tricharina praecox]KAI5845374.1 WD40-repeat-containing domain protein [Tricharina praecox]